MDSSQIGYLRPTSTSFEDAELDDFLQEAVVGITGLSGQLVRPRWQAEPPNPPEFGTDWASIGESERKGDTFIAEIFLDQKGMLVFKTQELEVLLTFYGPGARKNAQIFDMGIGVKQNQESMMLQGYTIVESGRMTVFAELQHNRWVHRVDISFRIRRSLAYIYPVASLVGVSGDVNEVPFSVLPQLPIFAFGLDNQYASGWGTGNWITQPQGV